MERHSLGPGAVREVPKEANWFYIEVTAQNAPWAFHKKDPQRLIAALELMGTLLSIIIFDIRAGPGTGISAGAGITGVTDNLGMSMAASKGLSTKFPVSALLIELTEQLRYRSLDLALEWKRRDENTLADAITNQDFKEFDENLRLDCDLGKIQWQVLDEVLESSHKIFLDVSAEREKRREKVTGPKQENKYRWAKRRKLSESLKWSQPW